MDIACLPHAQVAAEGDAWQPRTWRPGSVLLSSAAGASATVEATWLPTAAGALRAHAAATLLSARATLFSACFHGVLLTQSARMCRFTSGVVPCFSRWLDADQGVKTKTC